MGLIEFERTEQDFTLTHREPIFGDHEAIIREKRHLISFETMDEEPLLERLMRQAKREGILIKLDFDERDEIDGKNTRDRKR